MVESYTEDWEDSNNIGERVQVFLRVRP